VTMQPIAACTGRCVGG